MIKHLLFLILMAFGPLLVSTHAWPQGPSTGTQTTPKPAVTAAEDPKIQMWPDKMWKDLSREVDRSGTQLTNIIFDQLDEFNLWGMSKNSNSIGVSVSRSVLDNQDVLNTYTVNDQFSIDLGRNATEFSVPLVPSVATPINFNLGIGGRLIVNHMRQVYASKYPELPRVEDIKNDLTEEDRVYQKKEKKWWELDPSWRPHLAKFWNPLIAPYRIPWTREGLEKIRNGDLISYTTSGYVSVGLEGGFVPLRLAPGVDLSAGVGAQVFVRGEFRVTLLKEDERFVRVKITKMRSFGQGVTLGATTNQIKITDGILIFEGKKLETEIPEQKITVIPFKVAFEHEKKKQFDIGYRFDLNDPQAEEAFEKAMRGNLKVAEEVSKTNSSVTHLLTREALEDRRTTAYQLGLKWLYNFGNSRETKNLWATIRKPDGTTELFKSSLQMSKAWSTIWGTGEKQNFLFTTVFDKTAFEKKADNTFQLVTEATYEDVHTSGKEMAHYIRDIESVLGSSSILPELPLLVPKAHSDKLKLAQYKRSSFYFGQYFSQKQVMKFLMTPPMRAWDITYKSFDYVEDEVQKSGKVKRFYNFWMGLQKKFKEEMNIEQMVEALEDLRKLFRYQGRAIHAMKALAMSLEGEEIDYFITATNRSFGRIQFRGRAQTNAEKLLQLADETVAFENKVGQYRPDLNAKITDLKIEQLPDSRLRVNFTMPKDIKYVYFKMVRSSGWKKVKTLKDLIYVNRGKFKEGANEWIIGPDSKDHLDEAIWNAMSSKEYYTLQVSGSLDGKAWGRVESFRFNFEPINADPLAKD